MSHMKWHGWGEEDKEFGLKKNERLLSFLKGLLDIDLAETEKKRLEDIVLPDITLPGSTLRDLSSICETSTDSYDRLTHSMGKGYKDLLRIRRGEVKYAPDAVVFPGTNEEVIKVLELADMIDVAVVPYGGGTSVVSGLEPGRKNTISLDTRKLDRILDIDKVSMTAHVQAGILGPELERKLNAEGFTLGHFPQSFEFSALGGWIATRGAGQSSTKYGKIEEMVEALTMCCPHGKISTKKVPASATGSDMKQVLIGSEGSFGVITDAVLRLHKSPEKRHYSAFLFRNFKEGTESLRRLVQTGITPAVARLSDAGETRINMRLGSSKGSSLLKNIMNTMVKAYVKHRGYAGDELCMMILGLEGDRDQVEFDLKRSKKLLDGFYLGTSPGRQWYERRFDLPYARDELMDLGVLVETLETSTNWSNLMNLYGKIYTAIGDAIRAYGVKGIVMAHVSHLYSEGASLYYTFAAKAVEGREIEQWHAIKTAATEAIMGNGGALSHHHGIGREHAAWLKQELGHEWVKALKELKKNFDPNEIMNPGNMGL